MKISLIMSACNQGNYLQETVASAMESVSNTEDLQIVVVNDCSEDGCCEALPDYVQVFKAPQRLGCSAGRKLAAFHAVGDVIIITDPHCFYPAGALDTLATIAIDKPAIVQPAVRLEGKRRTVRGGAMILERRGITLGRVMVAKEYPSLIGSIYAMSRSTYERLDRLPVLPGVWGKYENHLTAVSYRVGLSIIVAKQISCVHRAYRQPQHFPYVVPYDDPIRNMFWFHAGCFPRLYAEIFERMLTKAFRHKRFREDLASPAFLSFRSWLDEHAVISEEECIYRMARIRNIYEHRNVKRLFPCTKT